MCGCQTGADACGKVWAILKDIPVRDFPADWKTHGPKAGPFRNEEMATYGDALAVFPGNKGTRDMVEAAKRHGLKLFDFR